MPPAKQSPARLLQLDVTIEESDRYVLVNQGPDPATVWRRPYKAMAQGGFGAIYREECIEGQHKGQVRVVKVLEKPKVKQKKAEAKVDFSKELQAIAWFSVEAFNSFFVRSDGYYEDPTSIYITMDFYQYGDLDQYIEEGLPEEQAQLIIRQILHGLGYMHDVGFAHRDLKPANLLVARPGPNWHIKITDFGLSKQFQESITSLRTVAGTRGFMAPEQQGFKFTESASGSYTLAVDIWAAGTIAYLILAGELPFPTMESLLAYVQAGPFPQEALDPIVSAKGRTMIQKMMSVDPSRRPSAKTGLEYEWMMAPRPNSAEVTLLPVESSNRVHEPSWARASETWSTVEQQDYLPVSTPSATGRFFTLPSRHRSSENASKTMALNSKSTSGESKHASQDPLPSGTRSETHPTRTGTETRATPVANLSSSSPKRSIWTPDSGTADKLRNQHRKGDISTDLQEMSSAAGPDHGDDKMNSLTLEFKSKQPSQVGGQVDSHVKHLGASKGSPPMLADISLPGSHISSHMPSLSSSQDCERSIQARVNSLLKIHKPEDLRKPELFRGCHDLCDWIALSSDGSFLAAVMAPRPLTSKRLLVVWELSSASEVFRFGRMPEHAANICFSPDGRFLAATTRYTTHIFETSGWATKDLPSRPSHVSGWLLGQYLAVVAFSPDSSILAIGLDGEIRLWDMTTWSEMVKLSIATWSWWNPVSLHIAFLPMSKQLMVVESRHIGMTGLTGRTSSIRLKPVDSNGVEPECRMLDLDRMGEFSNLCISSDERFVAATTVKMTYRPKPWVQLYDIAGWKQLGDPIAGECLSFSADNRFLVVSNWFGITSLWCVPEMREVATIPVKDFITGGIFQYGRRRPVYAPSSDLMACCCQHKDSDELYINIFELTISES